MTKAHYLQHSFAYINLQSLTASLMALARIAPETFQWNLGSSSAGIFISPPLTWEAMNLDLGTQHTQTAPLLANSSKLK